MAVLRHGFRLGTRSVTCNDSAIFRYFAVHTIPDSLLWNFNLTKKKTYFAVRQGLHITLSFEHKCCFSSFVQKRLDGSWAIHIFTNYYRHAKNN